MGCFDNACVLSGLPIHYTDKNNAMILLCHRQKYSDLNSGPFREFYPFAFPIRGTYNDYGLIVDVVRDKNVEMLEKYFNLSIEQIIESCSGNGYGNNSNDTVFDYLCLTDPVYSYYSF